MMRTFPIMVSQPQPTPNPLFLHHSDIFPGGGNATGHFPMLVPAPQPTPDPLAIHQAELRTDAFNASDYLFG